ncbi:dnaJ protein subfamily C member 17 [Pelomyxa schiedti]|nr:dnaJ protein subfamily C member 17 [Pelomyxa schiedti]
MSGGPPGAGLLGGIPDDVSLYVLLGVPVDASPQQINTAYKEKAKIHHPDKNKGNPRAAEIFMQIKKAKEILLDQAARQAYDALIAAKSARQQRTVFADESRKRMADSLLERERAAKRSRNEEEQARKRLEAEIMRLKREGYERMLQKKKQQAAEQPTANIIPTASTTVKSPPDQGGTIKVRWSTKASPTTHLYTREHLQALFSQYGTIDALLMAAKGGSAVVSFAKLESAKLASSESGFEDNRLKIILVQKSESLPSKPAPPPSHVPADTPVPATSSTTTSASTSTSSTTSSTSASEGEPGISLQSHLTYERQVLGRLAAAAERQKREKALLQAQQAQEHDSTNKPTPNVAPSTESNNDH